MKKILFYNPFVMLICNLNYELKSPALSKKKIFFFLGALAVLPNKVVHPQLMP